MASIKLSWHKQQAAEIFSVQSNPINKSIYPIWYWIMALWCPDRAEGFCCSSPGSDWRLLSSAQQPPACKLGFLPDNVSRILTRKYHHHQWSFCPLLPFTQLHLFWGDTHSVIMWYSWEGTLLCMLIFTHFHEYIDHWLIFKDYSSRNLRIGKRLWGCEICFQLLKFSVNWPGLSRNMALDPMLFGDKTWNSFQQYKFFNLILWQNLSYIILHYLHCNDSFFESTTTDENLHSGFRI